MMSIASKLKANVHILITVPLILYALGILQGKMVIYLWILTTISYGGLLVLPRLTQKNPALFKILTQITWGGAVLVIYMLVLAFIQSLLSGQTIS